jgi:hypothetical protein
MRFAQKAKRWWGAQRVPGDYMVYTFLDEMAFSGPILLQLPVW